MRWFPSYVGLPWLRLTVCLLLLLGAFSPVVATTPPAAAPRSPYLLLPDRVFDGEAMHDDWVVLVRGSVIEYAGPVSAVGKTATAQHIELAGATLLPGLIEAHSHLLLHPYDETSWNDQVLKESRAERVVRATAHARATLMAGFTTIRDLGSEGAGYADVGIQQAIRKGAAPGPRMLVAGRAIVATGSYGPRGFAPEWEMPLGAETADGSDLVRVVRDQIGHGADWVKVYADYRWGPNGEARPTFSTDELRLIVDTATSSGRPTAAHASTPEGMHRAISAGVETIEHGDGGTAEVFDLMATAGVALCPTLAAGDAIARYQGWDGEDPAPERIRRKRSSFAAALSAGVTICMGGDSGVFSHGDNARELELMVEYGMTPFAALRAATSVNAGLLHLQQEIGSIHSGFVADLIVVGGNPAEHIDALRDVRIVMQNGKIVRDGREQP